MNEIAIVPYISKPSGLYSLRPIRLMISTIPIPKKAMVTTPFTPVLAPERDDMANVSMFDMITFSTPSSRLP